MQEPGFVTSSRTVYDRSAQHYVDNVGTAIDPQFEAPLDRAVLDAFAEHVRANGTGPVLDIGCGPGRVAAHLAARGVNVGGIDIAPAMIAAARAAHPLLQFDVGEIAALPADDGSMLAAVYWYSIITTPLSELPRAWRELHRVLAPDGHALIAFQAGDNEHVERENAYGSGADLTLYRHNVSDVQQTLTSNGFSIHAEIVRQPELAHETTPQALLFVRRET